MGDRSFSGKQHEEKIEEMLEDTLVDIGSLLTRPGMCSCGDEFEYRGLGCYVCPRCRNTFKNEYAIVRDFVDEYGNAYSILEISERTGVPKKLIDLFVKDNKFEMVKKQRRCRICRVPIEKGYYCSQCALLQIHDQIDSDRRKILGSGTRDADMEGKMHYLLRERKVNNDSREDEKPRK